MSIRAVLLFAAILAWAPATGVAQTTVNFPPIADDGDPADGNPWLYKLRMNDLRVMFDLRKGRIDVYRDRVNLVSLNETNGVDVELHIGMRVAVQNLGMQDSPNRLRYERR